MEQAGVPILTEDGKGYTLMEGYSILPVIFTENQANALILTEQLVLKNKEASFVKDFSEATEKIKTVLRQNIKDKATLLAERTRFDQNINSKRTVIIFLIYNFPIPISIWQELNTPMNQTKTQTD